ncbi:MAG: hypothetical protein AAGF56_10850, partial [Pseudomonadota bacterium]
TADGHQLVITLPADEAARWHKALLKKPPTLADKLGIATDTCVFVAGECNDRALKEAIAIAETTVPEQASVLLAMVFTQVDLEKAADLGSDNADKHVWMINRKGKDAAIGANVIRTHMRNKGFIDSKSCAVSDQLSATRYRLQT